MGEHPNIALMREGYDAFARGDLARVREMFDPDIIWHVGGRSPLAGDYKGTDEVFDFFGKLFEMTAGTFKLDIHAVLADDEHAVVLTHATATRGDKYLSQEGVHVWRVRDGKSIEFWGFDEDQYAGDEFFS